MAGLGAGHVAEGGGWGVERFCRTFAGSPKTQAPMLWSEGLSRHFSNRRQVGAYVRLCADAVAERVDRAGGDLRPWRELTTSRDRRHVLAAGLDNRRSEISVKRPLSSFKRPIASLKRPLSSFKFC